MADRLYSSEIIMFLDTFFECIDFLREDFIHFSLCNHVAEAKNFTSRQWQDHRQKPGGRSQELGARSWKPGV